VLYVEPELPVNGEADMNVAVMVGRRNISVLKTLFNKDIKISFFIDNNTQLSKETMEDKKIYSPYTFPRNIVQYIVILVYEYEIICQELIDLGVDANRIICLGNMETDLFEYRNIFNPEVGEQYRLKLKLDYMDRQIKILKENQHYFEQNYIYEAAAILKNKKIRLPQIAGVEETYQKIILDKCSISRYGDGEFEIMLGNKAAYQINNELLARRLRDILISDCHNHIVAIADDYGTMEGLNEKNKNVIRKYMTEEKREEHYALLDMEKIYYNAYISRPYVIYPHYETEKAGKRFADLKKIWDRRKILLVEGDKTRMGVGNDLFTNAETVERVITPNENAFDVYDEIYHAVAAHGEDKVILIALGPTATVLAYDLAKAGYWALDIGHLDLEYEWFLKGKGYSYIPHKYNNEMMGDTIVADISDPFYEESIVETVALTR